MINIKTVQETLYQLKEKPIVHQESINELLRNNSIDYLEVLGGFIMIDEFFNDKKHILEYIESKIEQAVKEAELKSNKLELDVENLKLTREYIKIQKQELINAPKQRKWNLIITSSVAILAASLSAWLTYTIQPKPQDVILNPTVLPTIQIVHDTVYVNSHSTSVRTPHSTNKGS
jgi:hypothetical protein